MSEALVSEMVERVARALCRESGSDPDDMYEQHPLGGPQVGWTVYVPPARAAIEAMREPGHAVINAVEIKAEERYNACPGMLRWYGEDVWAAGIDAALSTEAPDA